MVRAWSTFRTFAAEMTKIYAAMMLWLAGVAVASAQYVYHDFTDTTVATNQGFADVDFNNDSIADLRFTLLRDTGTTGLLSVVYVSPLDSARIQVAGQKRGLYYYPDRLAVGDSISKNSSLWQGFATPTYLGYLDYRYAGQHDPFAQWQAPYGDGFLAVRRTYNDTVVNGWVRLSIAVDGKSFTLKDAGYQAADDSVMFAGHIWIGVDEPTVLAGYSWAQGADQITLTRTSSSAPRSVVLIDAFGRVLLRGNWMDEEFSVPTSILPTGAYWLRTEGSEGVWSVPFRTAQ